MPVDDDRYRFQHHLIKEAVRGGLPPALRRAYHGALAAALEAGVRGSAPGGVVAQRLAHHFLLGDEPARAAPYVVAALDHVHGMLDFRRAAETAERALAAGDALPPKVRAHASLVLAYCALTHAGPDAAASSLEEARRLAVDAGSADLEVVILEGVEVARYPAGQL